MSNPPEQRVNWRQVGLFYGIAFGGAVIVTALIWLLNRALGEAGATVGLVITALLYMPLPLAAGLVVERVDRRRPLIAQEWEALRSRFWRTYGLNALVALLAILAIVALSLAVAWAAGALGVPGAGRLPGSDLEFAEHLAQLFPTVAGVALPPLAVLIPLTVGQGALAGLTINGLFGFGEEYGWRGVLADLLRPLGLVRATAVTGVLWGLWHAPIILLGHNYGAEWGWGIPVMVAWTVPFSFLLTWTRERTGSVLAPAMLHGAYNGVAGLFTLLVIGGNVLIALPAGLTTALVLALLALGVWRLPTGRQQLRAVGVTD